MFAAIRRASRPTTVAVADKVRTLAAVKPGLVRLLEWQTVQVLKNSHRGLKWKVSRCRLATTKQSVLNATNVERPCASWSVAA